MKCDRCKNEDPALFGYDHGVYYCRKCIDFSRLDVGEKVQPVSLSHRVWDGSPSLKYALTDHQKQVSHQAYMYLCDHKDVLIFAAAGAGKTECVFESICGYLKEGKKVCFAISRRQVVLEIAQRLRIAFPELSVVEVAQDYTTIIDADLIVCTMHQLYRYPYAFDLLILDEIDAFPFVGNEVLQAIANQSCIGQKLFLTATPNEESLNKVESGELMMVCLFERPHKHPLIVPKVKQCSLSIQVLLCIYYCLKFKNLHKQVLLFVPKKQDTRWMRSLLSLFVRCSSIHSQSIDKDQILESFRNKELDVLICTTLLERGITIPSVQVIVFHADHLVFTTASLIQIYGRVGRSFDDPEGEGICLCQYANKSIKDCIKQLKKMNDTVFVATNA